MLNDVKLALRIASNAFDNEIQLYIDDCIAEMTAFGVNCRRSDPQIKTSVIAYCKWKFGQNDDQDKWESIYHQKLAQLKTMSGYTSWEG